MGVGAGLYMCDVVKKSSRSLSHLLMSSCTNRAVNIWNSLHNHVVLSDTVNMFKCRLDKFWQHQDVIYDFKAEIHEPEVGVVIRY